MKASPQPWKTDNNGYTRDANGNIVCWLTNEINGELIDAAGPMKELLTEIVRNAPLPIRLYDNTMQLLVRLHK